MTITNVTTLDTRPETRIALDKLTRDLLNVRKTYSAEGIAELAASIKAVGLLKNLVVRKAKKRGEFYVTAGGRRLAAMQALVAAGDLAADYAVRVITCSASEALEISLAENVTAEAMHPVDEFEAYSALVSEQVPVTEIAARFGKTDAYVRQRMALARVSPRILQAYREEECTFDTVAAFTISDDHARQDEVWATLNQWNSHPSHIKRLLSGHAIPANDRRVRFLGGLAAYEAAGGPVRRDLFDTTPNAGYALDEVMLESLLVAKIDAEAEAIRAEGWAWVEGRPSFEWQDLNAFQRIDPEPVVLTKEQSATHDALLTEHDELERKLDTEGDDEAGSLEARIEELDALLNDLTESRYTPADMASAGALVVMTYNGDLAIHRGLRRPEARKTANSADPTDTDGADREDAPAREGNDQPAPGHAPIAITHSAVLLTDLTAQKTAALRVELANNPDIALVAVVHALLLGTVYPGGIIQSALEIRITHTGLKESMKAPADNTALAAFEDLSENYGHALPGDPADLWEHLSRLSRDELLSLLAFVAAHGVNAVDRPFDGRSYARAQADQLGQALAVDMTRWFKPTGAGYFQHINRSGIEAAVAEAKGEEAAMKVRAAGKKSEAVAVAERLVAGSGWLPLPVRIPVAEAEAEAEESGNVIPYDIAAE